MPGSDGSGDQMFRGEGGFMPPPSTPRRVSGGIRLQTTRGASSWWARRWLAALEAIGLEDRLERGREYARGGQVRSLEIELGLVRATVQGTRRTPYETRIEVAQLTQLQWLDVSRQLAARVGSRAALLAGRMPEDVEAVFARAGVALFPTLEDDLRLHCTCDDWARPCRHAAAACHLVGEAFDRDPLLMFRLRGIEREVLLAMLGDAPATARAGGEDAAVLGMIDPATFWHEPAEPVAHDGSPEPLLTPDLQPPVLDAPLLRVLGAPPLWRGAEDFLPLMRRLHARLASDPRALDAAAGSGDTQVSPAAAHPGPEPVLPP